MIKPEKIEQRDGPKNSKRPTVSDDVRLLLQGFGRVPLLSVEEEQWLGRMVRSTMMGYRRAMLENASVAEGCIEYLEDVQNRDRRIDRVLEVNISDASAKQAAQSILRMNLATIRGILSTGTELPGAGQSSRAHRADLHGSAQKVASLIDETKITTAIIESVFLESKCDSTVVDRARARYLIFRNRMVEANLRLAVPIAKQFLRSGVPLVDLIQEGVTGLVRATEKFDPARGLKFSTYACWWIRQRVSQAAKQRNVIRVADSARNRIRKLLKDHCNSAEVMDSHSLSFEMICPDDLKERQRIELRRIYAASRDPVSIDEPLLQDDASSFSRMVPTMEDPQDTESQNEEQNELLKGAMRGLTERERRVIEMRYGMGESEAQSLAEVASELSLSRERIRQLERQALGQLRLQFENFEFSDLV